jgi:hypothetical protein
MAIVPTTRARLLVIGLVVLSIGVAVATFIFAPDFMQVGQVEMHECGPSPVAPGAIECAFTGYEAIYGGPWYWGFVPGIIALAIALGVSLIVADKCNFIKGDLRLETE